MSDTSTATATKKYKVIAKLGVRIKRAHLEGDVIELTDNQARYLLLNSKIELDDKSSTTTAQTEGTSHKSETK